MPPIFSKKKAEARANFSPGHGYFPAGKFRDPSLLVFARSGLAKLRFSPFSARASPSPCLLLLTGAVHLLDILFCLTHKISQKVLRKCPTLSHPRTIVAGGSISDFAFLVFVS